MSKSSQTILLALIVVFGSFQLLSATNYYVSPTGNDSNDGLSPQTAWLYPDNGDLLGILSPDDTINIIPGNYFPTRTIQFTRSGSIAHPIVYRKHGKGIAIFNGLNRGNPIIQIEAAMMNFEDIELTNVNDDAIVVNANTVTITGCFLHEISKCGIKANGNNIILYKNIIAFTNDSAIKIEGTSRDCYLYGNTIYGGSKHGIEIAGSAGVTRIFNNIVAENLQKGLNGDNQNICGFNNVWGNIDGNYSGGIVDSAGGISTPPMLVDPAAGRFDLRKDAPELNAGFSLGYPYNGSAPDIGAIEKYNVYYVKPVGCDSCDGRSIAQAWASIDNGNSILLPGDSILIMPGSYSDSVIINDSGNGLDDEITFCSLRDSSTVNGAGAAYPIRLNGSYLKWDGISVENGEISNIAISGQGNTVRNCRIMAGGISGIVSSQALSLINCTIINNGRYGALISSGNGLQFYNNTFYNNGRYGLKIGGDSHLIINNIFVGHDSAAIWAASSATITHSDFFDNRFNAVGGASIGYGCLNNDPSMIDPSNGNVRLNSSSCAINSGLDIGIPFMGTAPDMGAYETGNLAILSVSPNDGILIVDSTYQFTVTAADSAGFPASPGEISWSHTFPGGTIGDDGIFIPFTAGQGRIIAASVSRAISDTTGLFEAVSGALNSLVISPLRDTVSADSTLRFAVQGYDRAGNPVQDLGNITWRVINGIGTIDNSGLFSAGSAGFGFIHAASDLGPAAITDTIVVIPGRLNKISVLPTQNIVPIISSYQYNCNGYDADSNFVSDLTTFSTWSTTDLGGNITSNGFYTAGIIPGNYFVKAQSGSLRDSAQVIVTIAGGLNHIRIELSDGTPFNDSILTTDIDTTRLYCRAYTIGSILIGDIAASWSVIGGDSIGRVNSGASPNTMLTLTKPGIGYVMASYPGGFVDSTGLITCESGLAARLMISPDVVSITADSSVLFSCLAFDLDGNSSELINNIDWRIAGNMGNVDSTGLFTPGLSGIGYVIATAESLTDTAGPITVISGILDKIAVSPDSTTISADSSIQFNVSGYDRNGNSCEFGMISWELTAPLGIIDSTGIFYANNIGLAQVVARSNLGFIDTSAFLQVAAGRLARIVIEPDSIGLSADSSLSCSATGFDSDNNPSNTGWLTWNVIGNIGDIDSWGRFTPSRIGSGRITANSSFGNISDTNTAVTVRPGILNRLIINPDSAVLGIGDTIRFSAEGYDSKMNPADAGILGWRVVGNIGNINPDGLFQASDEGEGNLLVQSNINNIDAISGSIIVQSLNISDIPLGNTILRPDEPDVLLFAYEISNCYDIDKAISSMTFHLNTRGDGNPNQRLESFESISIYKDINGDSLLSQIDSLIASTTIDSETIVFNSLSTNILPHSRYVFLVSVAMDLYPHDGDTLDIYSIPSEFITNDGTNVWGEDIVNSFGYGIIDGMTRAQITSHSTGRDVLYPSDTLFNIMEFDIPRNGYLQDTLLALGIINTGTATEADIDSLLIYADNGDSVWGGSDAENRLGRLIFTGSQWISSGLAAPLLGAQNKFFIAADLSEFPVSGATVAMKIPVSGIQVTSGNDGPIDTEVLPADTSVIRTVEAVNTAVVPIPAHELIPGQVSAPVWGLRLRNSYSNPAVIDSITFTVSAYDPGGATPVQLYSQIDSLQLYANLDDDFTRIGPDDSLLGTAILRLDGTSNISTSGFVIQNQGEEAGLSVVAYLNRLNSKNNNTLNLSVESAGDIFTTQPLLIIGNFPLQNPDSFPINAFQAEAVTVNAVSSGIFYGGVNDQLAMDFLLPGNGYSTDSLSSIRLINTGSFEEAGDNLLLKLWKDVGQNGFTSDDICLGQFLYTSSMWGIYGLNTPIYPGQSRYFVTLSVSNSPFDGGTLMLQVPLGGIEYLSGTDGPDDMPVENGQTLLVFPSNRVTVISIPNASQEIEPGSSNNVLLTFALYNGYVDQAQELNSLKIVNISRTRSTQDFIDYELGQISLINDSDKNRLFSNDSILVSGYFNNGQLQISGFSSHLAPESLSYYFIVADIPPDAIDSDSLAISIEQSGDFGFTGSVIVNGDLPLLSGGFEIINGSIRDQYELIQVTPRTVVPGDTSIAVFAFRPAINGDIPDTIVSLTIRNHGNASDDDISSLELWRDSNGDNLWESGDIFEGEFSYSEFHWIIDDINIAIGHSPSTLFLIADIATEADPNATFRAVIPLGECQYSSSNDGPIDGELIGNASFTVSNSALQVSYSPLPLTHSIGETIPVRATVTNVSGLSLNDVFGEIYLTGDSAGFRLDSSFTGPFELMPDETVEISNFYSAIQPGEYFWQIRAITQSFPDSSPVIQTNSIRVQTIPENVSISLVNTMPTTVTRGQNNIFPLSLVYSHPDTEVTAASIRLDSLQLTFEDGSGLPMAANDAVSRIVLSTGYSNLAIIDDVPSEENITLVFSHPVIVGPGATQRYLLLVDIDSNAVADNFALAINSPEAINLVDANTLNRINLDPETTFPLATASCRIDNPSLQMAISYTPLIDENINFGQSAGIIRLRLRHPGEFGNSQIQLSSLAFQIADSQGISFNPAEIIAGAEVKRGQFTIGELEQFESGNLPQTIQLTSPVILNPSEIEFIDVYISVKDSSAHSGFQFIISDSTQFTARDISSGASIAVVSDTSIENPGSVFPFSPGWIRLLKPAQSPQVCLSSLLSSSVIAGMDNCRLVGISIDYHTDSSYSPIVLKSILVTVLDSIGSPLDPSRLFDRIGFIDFDQSPRYQPYVPLRNGSVEFVFGDSGIVLYPGNNRQIQLIADMESEPPYSHFILALPGSAALSIYDATDTLRSIGISIADDCDMRFPFATAKTDILFPAARPLLAVQQLPVQITSPGEQNTIVFRSSLIYESSNPLGDLNFSAIRGRLSRRTIDGEITVSPLTILSAIHLEIDGHFLASDTLFQSDSLILTIPSGFIISRGTRSEFALRCDIKESAPIGNYSISFDDSSFIEITDLNLGNYIFPNIAGENYPIVSAEISITEPNLEGSFTNYPNPFYPSRDEATTIGFVLPEDGSIDLSIYSITGDLVKELAIKSQRAAGSYQSDIWDGANNEGSKVIPGTYICQISVTYLSGRKETHLRKIAMLR